MLKSPSATPLVLILALAAAPCTATAATPLDDIATLSVVQTALAECPLDLNAADVQKFNAAIVIAEAQLADSAAVIAAAKAKALEIAKSKGNFCETAKTVVPQAVAAVVAGLAPAPAKPAAPATAAAPAASSEKIAGMAAVQTFIGKTLIGESDGKQTFEHFLADGTVKLLEGGQISTGKWTIEGTDLCYKYPDEDKYCVRVEMVGDQVSMFEKDGTGWRYQLVVGNPKNL